MKNITLIKPDDWHVHFREGDLLKKLVPETSKIYNRAIVMPNLSEPITTGNQAINYRKEILNYSSNNELFEPLMTIYFTENLNINSLIESYKSKEFFAVKLYPSGATTNSSKGIKNISKKYNIIEKMCKNEIPLLIHGEVNDNKVDVFDREKFFIEKELYPINKKFPDLRITLEHITTKFAVDYINQANENLKASITPHHLILNRTDMLEHKIKPHYYCLPILKREDDRKELLNAAFNENNKFFLGTDSAPHFTDQKETSCGCAGIFNTINSIQMLAQVFENHKMLNRLEHFISINGPLHYKLPVNKDKITLKKLERPIHFKDYLKVKNENIKIFKPNFDVFWDITSGENV